MNKIKTILIPILAITLVIASGSNSFAHWYGYPYGSSLSMFGLYYPSFGILYFGLF
ncbi:hypothetical protein DSCW_48680 [Desulfosarcina widdelii]|uniref:Uncharacterized protein n=1 Tax=Desulfosarcina widdelii TaxID=947919 RepID=A0A5K7ZCJ1_9BACT|nr:hypothetical protein DSCW_48680 [Desulfosarcina widdelii]